MAWRPTEAPPPVQARPRCAGRSAVFSTHEQAGEEGLPGDLDIGGPGTRECVNVVTYAGERIIVVMLGPLPAPFVEPRAHSPEALVPVVRGTGMVQVDQPSARRQMSDCFGIERGEPGSVEVMRRPRCRHHVGTRREVAARHVPYAPDVLVTPVAIRRQPVDRGLPHGVRSIRPDAPRVWELVEERGEERAWATADVNDQLHVRPVVGDGG